jgi:hypothetical protein
LANSRTFLSGLRRYARYRADNDLSFVSITSRRKIVNAAWSAAALSRRSRAQQPSAPSASTERDALHLRIGGRVQAVAVHIAPALFEK